MRKRGPGTKGHWLTVWAMKASSAGVPYAEIVATMARMRRFNIDQIQAFLKDWKAPSAGGNA
jgi:hypothetical protein